MDKLVYLFGNGTADGGADLRNLLGGKGANLGEMARLGLPVPPGFTITTDVCRHFTETDGGYPDGLDEAVSSAMRDMETQLGRTFGSTADPLLVSVRSGARVSMPGMMDTVLNLGLNAETVAGLATASGNPRFAWDAYRRFVAMYGDVVLQVRPRTKTETDPFELLLERCKTSAGVDEDKDLDVPHLEQLVADYKSLVLERTGSAFPDDPVEQLWGAISAVFRSWSNPRAQEYRRMYRIPSEWGTAVNIQSMVYGNLGDDCATGVAFTRDPATGAPEVFGEYLVNAQGEDVVAGTRTPLPISSEHGRGDSFEEVMPTAYAQLIDTAGRLERHYRDMQDLEFTIERGTFFLLQTRSGKRTGLAAIRIATDLVEEGLIDEREALARVEADAMEHLLAPVFALEALASAEAEGRLLATGLPAGPGAASGKLVFHADDAKSQAAKGESVILARIETSPEDVGGMEAARGILTTRGGRTSHAALVARQRGKPCVVGCSQLRIDYERGVLHAGDREFPAGSFVSLDGTSGSIYEGEMATQPSEVVEAIIHGTRDLASSPLALRYSKILEWADRHRRLAVRANADTPEQAEQAVALGAEGIGLCRTEHMFFEGERVIAVRGMIMAHDEAGRSAALARLEPMQRDDFIGIFRAMNGRPVTIRTLDPPLHEFLPHGPRDIEQVAAQLGVTPESVAEKLEELREANPMLGHRGCRLGMVYPEITAMQARAILSAACRVAAEGIEVRPEIMIPLVGHPEELARQRAVIDEVAEVVFKEADRRVAYQVGTMIELPRAALVAGEIAEHADFFSYGTNDLTQTTFGISRDDAGDFLPFYVEQGVLAADPFETLDQGGVGQLVRIGTEHGRRAKADLKVGICGEHGGDPASIAFFDEVGLDYVSCSPRRLPVARVAAAQSAISRG